MVIVIPPLRRTTITTRLRYVLTCARKAGLLMELHNRPPFISGVACPCRRVVGCFRLPARLLSASRRFTSWAAVSPAREQRQSALCPAWASWDLRDPAQPGKQLPARFVSDFSFPSCSSQGIASRVDWLTRRVIQGPCTERVSQHTQTA
jgi:hypothetical protein